MAAPISVPVMASTVVCGPSHALVQVSTTIASFKPSGVTYTKTEAPKNVQAFSGFTVIGLKIEYPWIIHFYLILYSN